MKKKNESPSLISRDLRIRGDLNSRGEIHIDGAIVGDIQAQNVILGKEGSVDGKVAAGSVVVHGFVTGLIEASSVELAASAHVIGDTIHDDLTIEKGACIDGNFAHTKRKRPKAIEPSPKK